MLRSELYAKIAAENPGLPFNVTMASVDTVFKTIIAALEHGNRVELRGFGTFSCRQRKARAGRNPKNGAAVDVEPKAIPWFKASKSIKDRLTASD